MDNLDILPGGIDRNDLAMKSNVVVGLVDAALCQIEELDFGTAAGTRNRELDHVWAMVSALKPLATELSDLCDGIHAMPEEGS
ncbi:MAG: hypothetical protein AAFX90_04875 [Pseudomonadota bacterium]